MKRFFAYIWLGVALLALLTYWGEHHYRHQIPVWGKEDLLIAVIAAVALSVGVSLLLQARRNG